jgi:hypothetical protein
VYIIIKFQAAASTKLKDISPVGENHVAIDNILRLSAPSYQSPFKKAETSKKKILLAMSTRKTKRNIGVVRERKRGKGQSCSFSAAASWRLE